MSVRSIVPGCILLSAVLFSCVRPVSYERFIRRSSAPGAEYVFTVPMKDSLASYDISLFSRVDVKEKVQLKLEVDWIPPCDRDSVALRDTVYMTVDGIDGSSSLYRSSVRANPPGDWGIRVKVVSPPKKLRGMGIICRENGTR